MLEIIIALLLALGINTSDSESGAIVIDQQTGIVFGVGNTSVGSNSTSTTGSNTPVYMLVQDDNGEYRLVRR
ncbi:MAG: hypothetical protein KA347_11080 [Bacteroidia bacterium]|nr:hypothetical protein [Bacteroidia bacterium]MBP7245722.1 hypothetical protein [Bacteroidia bacterium]